MNPRYLISLAHTWLHWLKESLLSLNLSMASSVSYKATSILWSTILLSYKFTHSQRNRTFLRMRLKYFTSRTPLFKWRWRYCRWRVQCRERRERFKRRCIRWRSQITRCCWGSKRSSMNMARILMFWRSNWMMLHKKVQTQQTKKASKNNMTNLRSLSMTASKHLVHSLNLSLSQSHWHIKMSLNNRGSGINRLQERCMKGTQLSAILITMEVQLRRTGKLRKHQSDRDHLK